MFDYTIHFNTYTTQAELPEYAQQLWQKAQEAAPLAYAPYSNFFVGTAILLENNDIVLGANQENAAYPSGLCAERVALFQYGMLLPKTKSPIKAIAVVAQLQNGAYTPASPCGGCRQVMVEYAEKQENPIEIFFQATPTHIYHLQNLLDLMPIRFGSKNLLL